ncbi:RNA polymerase sigma-E factor [Nymphon striatum]|nr:RNA polymerase sigma-E factor [Nymphon striatum]
MARACERWDKIGTYDNPTGWCYRVAMNWATSRWRKRKREVITDRLPAPKPAEDYDFEEQDRLLAALRELSIDHRSVIVLRLVEDWSIAETAEALGIAPGTVQSRYARALRRLREEPHRKRHGSPGADIDHYPGTDTCTCGIDSAGTSRPASCLPRTPEPTPTATASADPTAVPPPTATSAAASGDAASSLPVTPDPSSEAIPTPTATQQVDPGTDAATQSDDGQDDSSQGDSSQGDVDQRETEPSDPNPDDPLQDETDPGQGEQPDPDDAGSVANDTQDPQEPLAEQPGDGEPVDPAIAAATGPVATTTAVDATVSQPTGLDDQPCTTGDGVTAATCDLLPPYSCVAVADARFGYQAIDVDGDGQVETCVALPVTTCDTTGDGVGDTPCTIEISGDEQGSGGENLGPDG